MEHPLNNTTLSQLLKQVICGDLTAIPSLLDCVEEDAPTLLGRLKSALGDLFVDLQTLEEWESVQPSEEYSTATNRQWKRFVRQLVRIFWIYIYPLDTYLRRVDSSLPLHIRERYGKQNIYNSVDIDKHI